jgi:hypothetical protein
MWTSENRPKYNRDKLRYPSDLTDDEWSHVEPLIPPAKRGGRKRSVELREIVNAEINSPRRSTTKNCWPFCWPYHLFVKADYNNFN